MATYDLTQLQLKELLGSTVIPSTAAIITSALKAANEYPGGANLIPVEYTAPGGSFDVSSAETLFINTV